MSHRKIKKPLVHAEIYVIKIYNQSIDTIWYHLTIYSKPNFIITTLLYLKCSSLIHLNSFILKRKKIGSRLFQRLAARTNLIACLLQLVNRIKMWHDGSKQYRKQKHQKWLWWLINGKTSSQKKKPPGTKPSLILVDFKDTQSPIYCRVVTANINQSSQLIDIVESFVVFAGRHNFSAGMNDSIRFMHELPKEDFETPSRIDKPVFGPYNNGSQ